MYLDRKQIKSIDGETLPYATQITRWIPRCVGRLIENKTNLTTSAYKELIYCYQVLLIPGLQRMTYFFKLHKLTTSKCRPYKSRHLVTDSD